MKEINTSKEYLFSLLTKVLVVLTVFWGVVYLVLSLLESINLNIELSKGQTNSIVILTLFIITFVIAGMGAFLFYTFIVKRKRIILEEKGIKITDGIIFTKERFIPYTELKDAHCDEDNLAAVDKLFKISVLKIHGNETFYLPGILNAEEIAKEIKLNIDANKEKKVDPVSLLTEEVKNLKNEINELKNSFETLKRLSREKEMKEKKQVAKKKFVLGPFDEKIEE
ncbi:MAG: hypothetical protein QXW80_01750 [Candidatus Micrarchaeia archaeon]